ncbi:hypothetical protein FGO68_gene1173 [Halteria grandinella]|uniref:Uncharacterized protein n=1 Tax=Halteria grandinella TaxID=5974 RepID=A0A8J8NN59_HALGN|nr:hypothetical protein FGO68_gene1173 [Halteria grandinella]
MPTVLPTIDPTLYQMKFDQASSTTESFLVYQVTPKSLAQGAAQIGGLASFLGIAIIALRYYNRKRINEELNKMAKKCHQGKEGPVVFSFEEYSHLKQSWERESKELKDRTRKNEVELAILQAAISKSAKMSSRSDIEQINASEVDQLLSNI